MSMSMPSASLFIIISVPYAISVYLYLVSCALVGSPLGYASSILFGTTQPTRSTQLCILQGR